MICRLKRNRYPLSMDMPWLAECPVRFVREDPEYFELMMKVVGNSPW